MQPFVDDPSWDPVTRARAFQQWEISLIGDRKPAEVQEELPARLSKLMEQAGPDAVMRPEPDGWSPLEVLAHLVDTEIPYAARYRYILAHDDPPLVGFDPDLVMARLHPRIEDEDPAALLELLATLRRANVALWRGTGEDDRARVAIHPERGPESLDTEFRQIAGHGVLHLDQIARALEFPGQIARGEPEVT
jgi:DinB superfamily